MINEKQLKENFMKEFSLKLRKIEEQKQEMSSNVDYINWLNRFTLDKEGFSSDTWLYNPEELTDEDNKNVDKLFILYEIVNEYAFLNNIKSLPCDFGNYYLVRLDDFGFELGILIGQGTIFYCKRVSIENESNFIDYKKIVNNKIKRLK